VSLVICAHDAEAWLAGLDRDHERQLRETIQLDHFGADELADILDRRAQRGLRPDAVSRPVLEEIADGAKHPLTVCHKVLSRFEYLKPAESR